MTFEEPVTLVSQIEVILNLRPLIVRMEVINHEYSVGCRLRDTQFSLNLAYRHVRIYYCHS